MALKLLAKIDSGTLVDKVNFLNSGDEALIVIKAGSSYQAIRNRCRHESGTFKKSSDCLLTCVKHGWVLNAESLVYVNPKGGLKQDQLILEEKDGWLEIYEQDYIPVITQIDRKPLRASELQVRFYVHACVEIKCGDDYIYTDPWVIGPAFSRGWWLVHKPPVDWLENIVKAKAVYISHNHSDHLNIPSLQEIVKRNPSLQIFVPAFKSRSCTNLLEGLGFTNVKRQEFYEWIVLSDSCRMMIVPDTTGRDDSGMLLDYKGHLILNTVDCSNLDTTRLPKNIDLMMSSFASGASGYPVCWSDLYSQEFILERVARNRDLIVERVTRQIRELEPKVFMPFAGYFSEEHPADLEIKQLNQKNTAEDLAKLLQQKFPDMQVWNPNQADLIDLSDNSCSLTRKDLIQDYSDFDFDKYLKPIREAASVIKDTRDIESYFKWSGFVGNLVLHVIETDENFQELRNEFLYDFLKQELIKSRPGREHNYLRMKVRQDIFRYVLVEALPWEEISIGFQGRFYREPDCYNFDFWDHFQNKLPAESPFRFNSKMA